MFAVTLVTVAMVTFLWNIIGHGESTIDWENSLKKTATEVVPEWDNFSDLVGYTQELLQEGIISGDLPTGLAVYWFPISNPGEKT